MLLLARLRAFVTELRRRRVFRVVAVYVLTAVAVAQAADVMLPRLGLPDWTVTLVVALSVLGLPLVAVLGWAFELTADGIRRAPPPASGERAGVPPVRWRLGLVVGVVAVGVLGGTWLARGRAPAPPSSGDEARTIAVLPFSFRGGESFAYLGNGMVDLLSTKLDGAGALRSVGPRAVLGLARQEGVELEEEAAERVAARLGAGYYVLGQVVEVGGRLHISAAIHDRGGQAAPLQASVEGDAERIFALIDDLASQLLTRMAGGPGLRVTRVAAATTHSLPALKEYLRGEELLRGGHFPSALEAFETAIALDSTFALAYYRLSIAAEWSGSDEATAAAEAAHRLSGRLSAHDRRLVEAMLAWRRGDAVEAERLYRAIVGAYPDDVEAWFQLAEVLFHYRPWQGGSITESREAFERVLYYEPEHVTSLWHLARVAAVEGDVGEVDSITARVLELAPEGDRALELMALRAAAAGDTAELRRLQAELAGAIDLTRFMTVWNLSAYAGDPVAAHEYAAVMADPSRAAEVRATGHLIRAHMDYARGRPSSAAAELERVRELDPDAALLHDAAFALFPGLEAGEARLREIRRGLRERFPDVASEGYRPPAILYFDPATDARGIVAKLYDGLLSARIGDAGGAEAAARALEAVPPGSRDAGIAADFVRTVRAELAVLAGDTAAAIQQLERLRGEVWYARVLQSHLLSQPYARFRVAELLEAAGRSPEALRWLSSFDELNTYDLAWHPFATLRAEAIHRRLGDTAAADRARREAERLLRDAEPSVRRLLAGS